MSDRKNRDKGRKNANRRVRWTCNCWLCISDSEKKRVKEEKQGRKQEHKYIYDE